MSSKQQVVLVVDRTAGDTANALIPLEKRALRAVLGREIEFAEPLVYTGDLALLVQQAKSLPNGIIAVLRECDNYNRDAAKALKGCRNVSRVLTVGDSGPRVLIDRKYPDDSSFTADMSVGDTALMGPVPLHPSFIN